MTVSSRILIRNINKDKKEWGLFVSYIGHTHYISYGVLLTSTYQKYQMLTLQVSIHR